MNTSTSIRWEYGSNGQVTDDLEKRNGISDQMVWDGGDMVVLDNAVWLTGSGGTAANGSTTLSDAGNSTTVTGTFTAGTWDDDQSGYNISDFGAFGVTGSATMNYQFSAPVEDVSFDFQHINDDGGSTYDDQWTIYIYDDEGDLIPSADVIAAFSGLNDEIVYANPDGSVTLEAQGTIANNVSFNLSGYQISEMELVLEPGPGGTQSGGSGISDISFSVPALDTDGDGVSDDLDLDDDGDGILDTDEGYSTTNPSTITITFDGDEYSSSENVWELRAPDGTLIASDSTHNGTVEITNVAISDLGDYTFTVTDSYGDGLTGGSNPGSYQIALDGVTVIDSGPNPNFGYGVTETFSVQSQVTTTDSDGDGIADHLDLDSDNDGITDNVEAQTTAGYVAPTGTDSDNDGLDDAYEGSGDQGLSPIDSDGDGTDDVLDTDSDDDGIADVDEAGHGATQADIDASGDSDGDGIADVVDDVDGFDANDNDVDGSGNFTLADSDNDTADDGSNADPSKNDFDYRDNVESDGIVSGTSRDDVIDQNYLGDPEGDKVDNNDATLPGAVGDDDFIIAGDGNDTVIAGAGDDTVQGGTGDDHITGGTGADNLSGGSGNDTIVFSDGDSVDGGSGSDTIRFEEIGETGNGTITIDGGAGDEGAGGDTLDLGDYADLSTLVATDDGTGSFSGSVTMDDGTLLNFSEIENIICFTPGTLIATPKGARDVADLRAGDMVVTRDHGLQPIRWIQSRTVPATGKFAPVRIKPGVITGAQRDIIVSPQHRMLFQGYQAELLFGESEVLVSALHLVDGKQVTQDATDGPVTYIHMMFDTHEIIYAEGAATESFHPGDVALSAITDAAREELFALFPELRCDTGSYGYTARRCLKRHEAGLLVPS